MFPAKRHKKANKKRAKVKPTQTPVSYKDCYNGGVRDFFLRILGTGLKGLHFATAKQTLNN